LLHTIFNKGQAPQVS